MCRTWAQLSCVSGHPQKSGCGSNNFDLPTLFLAFSFRCSVVVSPLWMEFINITGPAATQITGWHYTLFILYPTARLHCVCCVILYFILLLVVHFFVIFSLRATMLINLNLNLNLNCATGVFGSFYYL